MEAIVGTQILTDADCASAFQGRLTIIIVLAVAVSFAWLIGCVKACLKSPVEWRRMTIRYSVCLAVTWFIAAVLYFGTLAVEGRRQTIAEEGVRGLSLAGTELVIRYCQGRSARQVTVPVSEVSDWAFFVEESRGSVGIRLRFSFKRVDGGIEWPEYRNHVSAFRGIGAGPLARLAPEIASGIDEVVRTRPGRRSY